MIWLLLGGCVFPRGYTPGPGVDTLSAPAAQAVLAVAEAARPRNVVLVIGDGYGLSQITAARVARGGPLALERFAVVGLQQTWSANALVTDSAASATAMAAGVKTDNGVIGMAPDGRAVPSVLHRAEAAGWATGVVATSRITHATPAAFVAHQPDRHEEEAIAADFLDVELEVMIGGGADRFSAREDGRDLLAELQSAGVAVVRSAEAAAAVPVEQRLAWFIAEGKPERARERPPHQLGDAAELAIARLQADPEGFLLVLEGSQIDWGGHYNHTPWMLTEALELDEAIGRVLDATAAAGDTLVVVTADHETGGFALHDGDLATGEVVGRYVSHRHTATMVPVFATGPGAEAFAGVYDNTALHDRLVELLGWPPPP